MANERKERCEVYSQIYEMLPSLKSDEKITVSGDTDDLDKAFITLRTHCSQKKRKQFMVLKKGEGIIIRKRFGYAANNA